MIEFLLNDQKIEYSGNPSIPLVDVIRGEFQVGTKIGCREGDCGACTVIVGDLGSQGMNYRSMTSCIFPVRNTHKKHVLTIESFQNSSHPILESLKQFNATQCGFCTPGFVMSIAYGMYKKAVHQSQQCLLDFIDGNICRCTGYKSIEKAIISLDQQYFGKTWSSLETLVNQGILPSSMMGSENILSVMSEAKSLSLAKPHKYIANGTDFMVQNPYGTEDAIGFIEDMSLSDDITEEGDWICFGAKVTCSQLKESSLIQSYLPNLSSQLNLISSTPIRNMGTIVGNFVNASPIGDLSNLFLVLGATLELMQNNKTREVLLQDFFLDYKKFDLNSGEYISSFKIPKPKGLLNFQKVSKRKILDIASITSSMYLEVEDDKIKNIKISLGGVAPIPKLIIKTCNDLKNKPLDATSIKSSVGLVKSEIKPIDDIRGSSWYKSKLSEHIIFSHFIDLFPKKFSAKDFL